MAVRINLPAASLLFTLIGQFNIADYEHRVVSTVEPPEARMARGFTECCFEKVAVQPQLIVGFELVPERIKAEKFFSGGVDELQAGEERLVVKLVKAHDDLNRPTIRVLDGGPRHCLISGGTLLEVSRLASTSGLAPLLASTRTWPSR